MNLIKETEKYLCEVINSLGYDIDKVNLVPSGKPELGYFQINEAFSLAKINHENPREVAEKIVNKLDNRFTNVNIAGPGFINISFTDEVIKDYLNKGIDNFEYFIDKEKPKKIIVDYGGANAAKALHVGHMRSPNIGEAVKRLLKVLGHDVMGDVHLGDLGRQSGMLISEYKIMHPDSPFFDKDYKGDYPKIDLTTKDLGEMYPRANIAASNDPARMDEVREITAEIDKGNPAYTALWKQMVEISSKEIKRVYDKLNCTFELWEGELDAFKWIPDVLKIMKPYLYESEGALVCDVKRDDDNKPMPPLMVIKNDGATIYGTRDLGTIYSRMERFNPDEMWYFTDERQGLYFEQVFRASYKTGLVKEDTVLKHFGFGTVNGADGKPYKTRDGGVMELGALIDLIRDEVEKNIKEEITGSEREEIADKLAIATLKYADLLPFRKTDYIFDPVKFSSVDGKTGPYILYTIVRIKSLLKKANESNYQLIDISNDEVKDLLVKLLQVDNILKKSKEEATLNYISDYLYEILSLYNKFYNNNNILNETNLDIKKTYLALSKLTYTVAHNLLNILAIDEVDRM
jgi:arginyl-tRNA synthetase